MIRKNTNSLQKKDWLSGYLFILPNFVGFFVFLAVPVIIGFIISFSDYNGFRQFNFIGLQNYIKLFKDSFFITAFKNTIYYAVLSVPLTIMASLLLALALNRPLKGDTFFRTVYFFPSITSMIAIGIVWAIIFNPSKGPVNMFLASLGFKNLPRWLSSSKTALSTIVLIVIWKSAGYYMIMFLAGLKAIPDSLYEAAEIDGANSWQVFKNVTWPMLSPTTFMVTILCTISSFQVFDIINITTAGGPGQSTKVIVYRIYEEGFKNLKFGYASAMAYVLFLIILVITVIQFKGQKEWSN